MRSTIALKLALFLSFTALSPMQASAFEMLGLISYNFGQVNPQPSTYKSLSNGIGYTFLGRMDLGPGQLESGFQFTPTSLNYQETIGEVKATGSYWILPLLYRFTFLPPFFSIGVGVDYAVVGTNNLTVAGTSVSGQSSGYQSHFGAQVSFEANQDLGENLSAVLDVRYRAGLANAITISSEGAKYNFWIIALGIQKHLD
jgi:hypothetical protein